MTLDETRIIALKITTRIYNAQSTLIRLHLNATRMHHPVCDESRQVTERIREYQLHLPTIYNDSWRGGYLSVQSNP